MNLTKKERTTLKTLVTKLVNAEIENVRQVVTRLALQLKASKKTI